MKLIFVTILSFRIKKTGQPQELYMYKVITYAAKVVTQLLSQKLFDSI